MRRFAHVPMAFLAIAFGLATLRQGGLTIFGGPEAGGETGAIVPWVLWFNFLAGFFYVAAGAGFALRKPWSAILAMAIFTANLTILGALGVYIASGGAYEQHTLAAMTLRVLVWLALALSARKLFGGRATLQPPSGPEAEGA